jgi:ABC-2 type transport system permease protein
VAFVSTSATALWLGIFLSARLGFRLFERFGEEALGVGGLNLGDLVMARLLAVFALALFVMLIFSNVLIAFSTLYRSREVAYLVQSPISTPALFLGRFYECVTFSSWASAFLGSPVMLAYGLETGAPPIFYLALVGFYLPFVILPAALGSILTIVAVRFIPALGRGWWPVLGAGVLAALFVAFRGPLEAPGFSETLSLQAVIAALGGAHLPFLPSSWAANGVLDAARGDHAGAVFHFLLLLSNALFFLWLATLTAERWFYAGWSALAGTGRRRRRRRRILERLEWLLSPLPEPARSLVAKDLRLFWRDPAQWSQFVLFFGIMTLYVANLSGARSFAGQEGWRAWGTLLNLGAAMLILASLTTRFVYPLVSLEGRRFWILGLSPVTLRTILWQKFWLSVASTSVFTVSLAVLSAIQLGLDRTAFLLSVAGIVATTFALSGLAVGLGSLYPNFDEDNPARIVSGMGGTLNFLLSMVYVALVGCGQAAVLLWPRLEAVLGGEAYPWIVAAAVVWTALLTAVTCLVPLRLGLRNLERVEL